MLPLGLRLNFIVQCLVARVSNLFSNIKTMQDIKLNIIKAGIKMLFVTVIHANCLMMLTWIIILFKSHLFFHDGTFFSCMQQIVMLD